MGQEQYRGQVFPKVLIYAAILLSPVVIVASRLYIAIAQEPRPLSWSGSAEAFAHLYVGGLIGAALCTGQKKYWFGVAFLAVFELAAAGLARSLH